jgi:CheY-like chemotaxis protein
MSERKIRILVVDDSRLMQHFLTDLLERDSQLRVLGTVGTGQAALEFVRLHKPDVVLMDINMPGMDGFELLERLRTDDALKQTAVVMCSTSSYDKDMDRARKLGVVGYMTKPADMTKLKPLLEKVSSLQLRREPEGYTLLRTA